MRTGKHNLKIESSEDLLSPHRVRFQPKVFNCAAYALHGSCGTAALSTLTKMAPKHVARHLPAHLDAWSDRRMISFLRKAGFQVKELTKAGITQSVDLVEEPVKYDHLLLISQDMVRNEGTWAVVYDNMMYHNFDKTYIGPLEFINHPLSAVYLLTPPKKEKRRENNR